MISDFKNLLEKIQQLADLSVTLRRENAELRHHSARLQADNAELTQRMREAHERITAVMRQLPEQTVTDLNSQEPA